MKKSFFIFDLDASAFRKNYTYLLVLTCVQMGLIPKIALSDVNRKFREYGNRESYDSYGEFLTALLQVVCDERRFNGISIADMRRVCNQLASRSARQTHVFWEELLSVVKESKYGTLIVTGSPEPAVKAFAKRREIDYWLATGLTVREGFYTGEFDDTTAKNKGVAVTRFIEEYDVDTSNSIVLGDSIQDLAMLKLVRFPIAIHPTPELYKSCRELKIPIVHEKRAHIYVDNWDVDLKRVEADFLSVFPPLIAKQLESRLRERGFLL